LRKSRFCVRIFATDKQISGVGLVACQPVQLTSGRAHQ